MTRHWTSFLVACSVLPLVFFFNNCSGVSESTEGGSVGNVLGSEFSGQVSGQLLSISASGEAFGWAFDPQNPDKKMRVHFYMDSSVGSGRYLGSTIANIQGVGASAGHYFSYQVPSVAIDGQPHLIYAYGHEPEIRNHISGAPINFIGLMPQAQSFYNQNLNSYFRSACIQCHSWSYSELFYGPLTNPSPFEGGSATNNLLVRKMNGSSGHGGGRFCDSNADFPCSEIQAWWSAEFD